MPACPSAPEASPGSGDATGPPGTALVLVSFVSQAGSNPFLSPILEPDSPSPPSSAGRGAPRTRCRPPRPFRPKEEGRIPSKTKPTHRLRRESRRDEREKPRPQRSSWLWRCHSFSQSIRGEVIIIFSLTSSSLTSLPASMPLQVISCRFSGACFNSVHEMDCPNHLVLCHFMAVFRRLRVGLVAARIG